MNFTASCIRELAAELFLTGQTRLPGITDVFQNAASITVSVAHERRGMGGY